MYIIFIPYSNNIIIIKSIDPSRCPEWIEENFHLTSSKFIEIENYLNLQTSI